MPPGHPTADCSSVKEMTFGLPSTTEVLRASCSPRRIFRGDFGFLLMGPTFGSPPPASQLHFLLSGRHAWTALSSTKSSPDGTSLRQNVVVAGPTTGNTSP